MKLRRIDQSAEFIKILISISLLFPIKYPYLGGGATESAFPLSLESLPNICVLYQLASKVHHRQKFLYFHRKNQGVF